jgi:hypothetical protein
MGKSWTYMHKNIWRIGRAYSDLTFRTRAELLFKIEENVSEIKAGEKTWQEVFLESEQELAELISKIPETELRSILAQLAQENESLRNHILTKYSSPVSEIG